jgi:hypothetical protein
VKAFYKSLAPKLTSEQLMRIQESKKKAAAIRKRNTEKKKEIEEDNKLGLAFLTKKES